MDKITSIITTYTQGGDGKRIYIIRSNGLTRDYPYSRKNTVLLSVNTLNWPTSYFHTSIHVTRAAL